MFIPELNANLAEPLQRILARVIDGLIVGIPNAILVVILLGIFETTEQGSVNTFIGTVNVGSVVTHPFYGYVIAGLITAAIAFAYEFFFTMSQGQTIGKKVMGCKIVRADGQPLDQTALLTRCGVVAAPTLLAYVIPSVGLGGLLGAVLWIASVVLLFTDSRRETVPDKAAKTLVIAVPK